MNDEGGRQWITIPNWDRFQHYKDRDPLWIKEYVSQIHDADWAALTFAERGLLITLRLWFAAGNGRVTFERVLEAQMSPQRRANEHLASLIEAGLVDVRASRPLALTRSREKSREEKKRDRASAQEPEQRQEPNPLLTNGDLEPTGMEVSEEMLRLARGWLDEHGQPTSHPPAGPPQAKPKPDPRYDPDNPLLG